MNTITHKSLTFTALALALSVTAGSAFAATQSCSTFGYTPRADTRASFLVSFQNDGAIAPRSLDFAAQVAWQNDNRIAPRSVGPTDDGERIAPHALDSDALLAWQNDKRIAPRSVNPTDPGERIAPRSLAS